jgi:hypothetical protein
VRKAPIVLETPVKEPEIETTTPLIPEELRSLEERALRPGMTPDELTKIQAIGRCPDQVQTRIAMLRRWISCHLR